MSTNICMPSMYNPNILVNSWFLWFLKVFDMQVDLLHIILLFSKLQYYVLSPTTLYCVNKIPVQTHQDSFNIKLHTISGFVFTLNYNLDMDSTLNLYVLWYMVYYLWTSLQCMYMHDVCYIPAVVWCSLLKSWNISVFSSMLMWLLNKKVVLHEVNFSCWNNGHYNGHYNEVILLVS